MPVNIHILQGSCGWMLKQRVKAIIIIIMLAVINVWYKDDCCFFSFFLLLCNERTKPAGIYNETIHFKISEETLKWRWYFCLLFFFLFFLFLVIYMENAVQVPSQPLKAHGVHWATDVSVLSTQRQQKRHALHR